MKIVAVVLNVLFWGFLCLVMATDGLPRGTDILYGLISFVMPILNVIALKLVRIRAVGIAALAGNFVWLLSGCWLVFTRYPSHPQEEGLLAYVILLLVTPFVSAVVLGLLFRARTTGSAA